MANAVRAYSVKQFSDTNSSEAIGLNALSNSITALNQQLADALPGIVMLAALVIEKEISARAPVDTGALLNSLYAKSDRRQDSASAIVEIARSGPDGTEHYAIFQEFGTSKMAAQPFFRPGIEAARGKIDDLMMHQINAVVNKYDR